MSKPIYARSRESTKFKRRCLNCPRPTGRVFKVFFCREVGAFCSAFLRPENVKKVSRRQPQEKEFIRYWLCAVVAFDVGELRLCGGTKSQQTTLFSARNTFVSACCPRQRTPLFTLQIHGHVVHLTQPVISSASMQLYLSVAL